MPVYNAALFLPRVLEPICAMRARGECNECIVVDDNSTDDSAAIARAAGATVLSLAVRGGPGRARNLGVAEAHAGIVWFVDADVVLHEDAARLMLECFADARTTAVFGAYDDSPFAPNFFSQYKNLLNHYHHQSSNPCATTFWSGCGAVRKNAFLRVRGFDEARYPRPSIEDIELGQRLHESGARIRLEPLVSATHLKAWSCVELISTDIFRRAIPWSELIVEKARLDDNLNISKAERGCAVLAGLLLIALLCAGAGVVGWWVPSLLLVLAIVANWPLALVFARHNGWFFALRALCFHQVYYHYSAAAYLWTWGRYHLRRVRVK